MKILLINYEYPPLGGGGGIETRDLAEELAKKNRVSVLTTGYGDLPHKQLINNVTIYRVPVLGRKDLPTASLLSMVTFFPAAFLAGLYLIINERPNIINAHFAVPSGLPAVLLAKIFNIPFVLTLIGGDIYDPSKGISPHRHSGLRVIINLIMRGADKLTAISKDTKKRVEQYFRPVIDIEVVPLGLVVPAPVDENEIATFRNNEEKNISFMAIGRLVSRKGYDDLLNALAALRNRNTMLHIIGDGPLMDELKNKAKSLNIKDRVILHGRVSEKEKMILLAKSDAYVSASQHEGFGICFLEAMHSGLPIMATDTGGQTDFLVPGRNAFLVPVGDVVRMAEVMEMLSNQSTLRQKMGTFNKTDIKQYLISSTANRYQEIFDEVTGS